LNFRKENIKGSKFTVSLNQQIVDLFLSFPGTSKDVLYDWLDKLAGKQRKSNFELAIDFQRKKT